MGFRWVWDDFRCFGAGSDLLGLVLDGFGMIIGGLDNFLRFGVILCGFGWVWDDFRWFGVGSGALGCVSRGFGMIFGGLG